MLSATAPIVLLLHGGLDNLSGKTGLALLRYRPGPIVAVVDQGQVGGSLEAITGIRRSVPVVGDLRSSLVYGPQVAVVGLAPSGGTLPAGLRNDLLVALDAGLSVASGLHTRLGDDPELASHCQSDQWIWDLRQEPPGLVVASGLAAALSSQRILTLGTDMAVGKMSACLELVAAARRQGFAARFVGTGQAGILISGAGVPLDAVRVDYAAGAVEQAVLQAAEGAGPNTTLFVEGQGSRCHPGSSASLPLIRGCQPTGFLLVHRAGQNHVKNHPSIPLPPLAELIATIEQLAALGRSDPASPAPKVRAVALNTARLSEAEAQSQAAAIEAETGLTCDDPVRNFPAADRLLEAIRASEGIRTPVWRHHKPLP